MTIGRDPLTRPPQLPASIELAEAIRTPHAWVRRRVLAADRESGAHYYVALQEARDNYYAALERWDLDPPGEIVYRLGELRRAENAVHAFEDFLRNRVDDVELDADPAAELCLGTLTV